MDDPDRPGRETESPAGPRACAFAAIPGEMARRVCAFEWSRTALGPIENWPASLTTAVGMILHSPVPIVMLWGEDGIMLYNDAYSVFAAGRHPALLGSKVREGWPEVADFNDNVMKVGLSGSTLAYRDQELTLYRNGRPEQVWMNLDYSPIPDESGKPAGVMAIVIETTERVRADAALRQSEERLRFATQNAEVGLWDIDLEENIDLLYAQERGAFSMPRDRKTSWQEFLSHVHPDDVEAVRKAYAAARDPVTRSTMDIEYRTLRMPGIPARWIAVRGRGVFDEQGRCVRMSGTAVEITQRKEAELALRESEQRFREIANAAPVIIWIADADMSCTWFNRSALDFTGRAMEEELGSGWADNLHPDDHAAVFDNFRSAYAARQPFRILFRMRRHDGEWRVLDETAVPRFDPNANFLGFIGTCTDITERHQTEEALRDKEEQLRVATEHGEVGLWDFDVARGRAFADARVKAMFGLPGDFRGPPDDYFAMIHPADVERVTDAYRKAFDPALRAVYDVEYRVDGKDGSQRWVAAKGRGIFDDQGNCLRVSGSARDITREKEIAEALRRNEEQLRLATEYAEVGLWDVDVLNDTLYWPPRVNRIFGIPEDEIVTLKEFRARIHPEDRRRIVSAILAACDPRLRAPYDVEYRIVRRQDGKVRWVAVRGRAVFDDQERCVRMLGIVLDITARKEIEAELRELTESLERRVAERTAELTQSEKNIRTIFETSHLYQGLISTDGTLLYINATALSGVRGTFDEVVGKPFWNSPWFETTPGMTKTIKAAVERAAKGETANMSIVLNLPIGTRAFDFSLRPVRDIEGKIVALVPEAVDVTARLKAEAALQQAHKMEAIGNLTGGIAHDFNNLLQGLTGSLDLIRRKPDARDRVRRWAEAGLQAAERGAKLTAQLLAFSRSQKLEMAPIDLARLLQESRELLMRTLGPKIRVTLDLDVRAGPVLGDETQLEMAVLNLAINARDAMPEGGDVMIGTRRRRIVDDPELATGDYVELSVSDTGAGMPPDVVARAFDPFFTTKGVGKGTGLGLSQVYGMARQAGGLARIRSTPGQGTTIAIVLRATTGNVERPVSPRIGETAPASSPATVLVVDDDAGVRQFLGESLESFGYAVLQAEDGYAGLALAERARPDVMIVDYAMPGLTGAEVALRIRRRHPALPVIFASGYADTSALEGALHQDSIILRKPFRVNELQDAVKRALEKGEQRTVD